MANQRSPAPEISFWQAGQKIAIDTAIFIYLLERPNPPVILRKLFSDIENRRVASLTSVLMLSEVYPQLITREDTGVIMKYREFFGLLAENLDFIDVTKKIAESAATMRAWYKLDTPDAVHLATAIDQGADFFVTNDWQVKKVKEIAVITLKDL